MTSSQQSFERQLRSYPNIRCVDHPQQRVQLKVLFERIANRDITGIRRFKTQGFKGIFRACEPGSGNTALHVAAYKNDVELISYFVDEGADINARNKQGITPIMVAAHHGFLDAVKQLALKGADLDIEDVFGQTILWYCFGGTTRHTQVAAFCLNEGTLPTTDILGKPVLVRACEKGNKAAEVVELFLDHGADVNAIAKRSGRTGLIEACRRGAVALIQLLLQHGASVDAVDYKKVHAAHEAAYHGHVPALQLLRGAGGNLDMPAYNGNTPLHLAAASQQLNCVRFLAQRGANVNQKNAIGLTPLTMSKKYGLKPAMKEMKKAGRQFSKMGENKFLLDIYDWLQNNTQKLEAPIGNFVQPDGTIPREDAPAMIEMIEMPIETENIEKLLNVLDPKSSGSISAVDFLSGNKLVPKALRKENFPADPLDAKGKLPKGKKKKKKKKKKPKIKLPKGLKFTISCNEEQPELRPFVDSPYIIKYVHAGAQTVFGKGIEQPATPFTDDSLWILDGVRIEKAHFNTICQLGDWDSLARACQKGFDVNQCDAMYKTPLMYSAMAGRYDMVQLLLGYGANPSLVDNFGWSALHHACRKGQAVVVEELIRNGANVNGHTLAGATPLMKAIESNNLDSVICCVMHGANLRSKSVSGLSVQDYARQFGNYRIYRAIAKYLKSYRGSRMITKDWAAIDPNTKFMYGDKELVYEYGKDVRGTFRKGRHLNQKNVLKSLYKAEIPVRAIKPKAVKTVGFVPVATPAEVDTGKLGVPPRRIPVSNTGKPLPMPPPPPPVNPHLPPPPMMTKQVHVDAPKPEISLMEVESDDNHLKATSQNNTEAGRSGISEQILKEPVEPVDPKLAQKHQQAQKFFALTWNKFDTLDKMVSSPSEANPASDPRNTFFHEIPNHGRSMQTFAMEFRTEMERNAWMLKNHIDLTRSSDLTFYAPAPEDWYPPTKEDIIKRYHLQPGLFDRMIKPSLDQDPLEKYVVQAEEKLRAEQQAKKFTAPVKPTQNPREAVAKRFSITEELKKLNKMRAVHDFDSEDQKIDDLPRMSLMDNFLEDLKKQQRKASVTLDIKKSRLQTDLSTDVLKMPSTHVVSDDKSAVKL